MICSLFVLFFQAASAQKISILETVLYHGEEISSEKAGNWIAVFDDGKTTEFIPVITTLKDAYDPVVDDEGAKTGIEVTINDERKPQFLLRGIVPACSAPCPSTGILEKEIKAGAPINIDLGKRHFELYVESPSKADSNYIPNNARLILADNRRKQVLFEVGECVFCYWSVKWVGDIDGDSLPDLLLYVGDHYNVARQKLFLSSFAENGKFVKEVAEIITSGC
ncbi:MAG: hypothetical protein R2684_05675 [Pyrinomonadaceae bacterium]